MRREGGFTLFEALVAFAVAALFLGFLFREISTALGNTHIADRYLEAVSRARSHLAGLAQDVSEMTGIRTGDDGGGFRWRLVVEPLSTAAVAGMPGEPPHLRMTLYDVTSEIDWREGSTERSVKLATHRLTVKRIIQAGQSAAP